MAARGQGSDDGKRVAEDIERARNLARLLIAGLVRGEDPRVTLRRHRADALTVGDLCARALEAIELRAATREGWAGHIRRDIKPTLGDVAAAALSRDQIRRWGDAIAKRSGYSANRAFEVLRRCYSWGVETDLLGATPFVRLPKPFSGERPRAHVMTVDELAGLVQALTAEPCGYANAVWLLLLTGVRKEEVRGARVDEFEGDLWRVPGFRTKNGQEHVVPLSPQARAVIARQRQKCLTKVYTTPLESVCRWSSPTPEPGGMPRRLETVMKMISYRLTIYATDASTVIRRTEYATRHKAVAALRRYERRHGRNCIPSISGIPARPLITAHDWDDYRLAHGIAAR